MLVAERDQHRAGQRGKVDDARRLEFALRPAQRVGQDQPPFGIGVEHFDGLAVHGGEHVARADGIAIGHVLDKTANAHDIGFRLAQGERQHGSGDCAGTAHVPFHVFHARAGLD